MDWILIGLVPEETFEILEDMEGDSGTYFLKKLLFGWIFTREYVSLNPVYLWSRSQDAMMINVLQFKLNETFLKIVKEKS